MAYDHTSENRPAVDWALLAIRLIAGIIMTAHGSQKLFGAFDGPGLNGTVQFLGSIGYLVAIGEFFGGLGILLGFLARFSSAANIVIMLGAIAKVHGKNGFFNSPPNLGFEYNLALIGLFLAVLIAGPGRFALARVLSFLPHNANGTPKLAIE